MQDKEELLHLHDEEQKSEYNLSFKMLLMAYLALLIALAIFLPKIYITNQIYYISRDITDLSGKRDALLEEKRELRLRVEQMNYKNQIINQLR